MLSQFRAFVMEFPLILMPFVFVTIFQTPRKNRFALVDLLGGTWLQVQTVRVDVDDLGFTGGGPERERVTPLDPFRERHGALPVDVVEPGQSVRFETPVVSAADILDDDLPDGEYRITVYFNVSGGDEIELDLGETDLAIPR